jgi:hypothetical protein
VRDAAGRREERSEQILGRALDELLPCSPQERRDRRESLPSLTRIDESLKLTVI